MRAYQKSTSPIVDAAAAQNRKTFLHSVAMDLLACIGLVNLLFLTLWREVQAAYASSGDYFRAAAPSPNLLVATLLLVLGVAAAMWGASLIVRRSPSRARQFARAAFLLAIAMTAPGAVFAKSFPYLRHAKGAGMLLDRFWLTAGVIAAALVLIGGHNRIFRVARFLTIVVWPLLPILIADATLAHWTSSARNGRGAFESTTPGGAPVNRSASRVLVLIFDEFDIPTGFSNRPASVQMPAFDRLRQETLWADAAYPPSRCTFHSLPMFMTGRKDVAPSPNESAVMTGRVALSAKWGSGPNLFSKARSAGARTAIIGWYHPYCSVLDSSVDYCWSAPSKDVNDEQRLQEYCRQIGLASCAVHILQRQVHFMLRRVAPRLSYAKPIVRESRALREWDLQKFVEYRRHLLGIVADPSYGLIVAHLPIPHPLGVYDRHADRLALNDESNYFDNLELADRTLGEVRAAMEQAGLWDATALIVTADHGFRPIVWQYRPSWTDEEATVTAGSESLYVPLMIKLTGHAGASTYTAPVNALIAHDLSLELLRGGITNYAGLSQWITRNREHTWIPEPERCF